MVNVAIIPARGGSKRIQKKNIKLFHGKPIIAYSIETALRSKLFDKVIVSTDCEEIAKVARQFGADVPFLRPKNLADDFTGTNAVVKHAIEWLESNSLIIDYACCIYATAPMLEIGYLQLAFKRLKKSDKQFSFSVCQYDFPIQRAIVINEKDELEPYDKLRICARSQDLEHTFHDAGQFYWGRAKAFIDALDMFSAHSIPVPLPRHQCQDIDTIEDWKIAESLYEARMQEIQFRFIMHDDVEKTFDWRNHSETRKFFFNNAAFDFEQHKTWLIEAIEDESRLLLTATLEEKDIAVLRFDLVGHTAEVSIYLDPSLHRQGFGTLVLKAGVEWVRLNQKQIMQLTARILPENIASVKAFERAGFMRSDEQYHYQVNL